MHAEIRSPAPFSFRHKGLPTRAFIMEKFYAVSRVPANLYTNLYCHMQEGAGTRAT